LVPGCDTVMMQFPVLLRITVAEETPFASGVLDWLPMEQGPDALKFTCNPLGAPPDMAVA
jgi:hypothetical protein